MQNKKVICNLSFSEKKIKVNCPRLTFNCIWINMYINFEITNKHNYRLRMGLIWDEWTNTFRDSLLLTYISKIGNLWSPAKTNTKHTLHNQINIISLF